VIEQDETLTVNICKLSFFRVNNIRENCSGGAYITGSISLVANHDLADRG
jgi:hypothetical protein